LRAVAILAVTAFWSAVTLGAQPQPPSGFVSIPESQLGQEQLPATPLVFAAYAFVWLALLTYVLVLSRRVRRAEQELAEVSSRLASRRP
jgi:CcmD family protein